MIHIHYKNILAVREIQTYMRAEKPLIPAFTNSHPSRHSSVSVPNEGEVQTGAVRGMKGGPRPLRFPRCPRDQRSQMPSRLLVTALWCRPRESLVGG